MRVAWFSHRYDPAIGGAEAFVRAMATRFAADGHSADVWTSDALDLSYFTDPRGGRVDRPAVDRDGGVTVHRVPVRHPIGGRHWNRVLALVPHWPTRCRFAPYMPSVPGLRQARGAYDLVFAVGFPFTVFAVEAWRTARACGAPLVLTPFLHLATPGDPVHRASTRRHQIRLLAEADLVVVVTPREARAVEGWGIPRDRLLVLPMALDHRAVTGGDPRRLRNAHAIPEPSPVVGQLGALDPNKGTTDLVAAVARLNDARPPDAPIILLLAGSATPDFQRVAATWPASWSRWLIRLGALPAQAVPDFYAAIDLFAMPSRTDSFGIVFLEAWANGKPVIAADAGGVPDVVDHGQTGLLVPFGAVAELAEAVRRLVDDPALARRLGEAGRARVARGATWDDRYQTLADRANRLRVGA